MFSSVVMFLCHDLFHSSAVYPRYINTASIQITQRQKSQDKGVLYSRCTTLIIAADDDLSQAAIFAVLTPCTPYKIVHKLREGLGVLKRIALHFESRSSNPIVRSVCSCELVAPDRQNKHTNMTWRSTCACLAAAAALAAASPVDIELAKRQWTGTISKEFSMWGCRDVIFAFARGSQETGNMVSFFLIPVLCN